MAFDARQNNRLSEFLGKRVNGLPETLSASVGLANDRRAEIPMLKLPCEPPSRLPPMVQRHAPDHPHDPAPKSLAIPQLAKPRMRFREGVPVSELVFSLLLTKKHLRRYIRDYGLVDFAGDRVVPDELLPVELHSIQELNYQVGEFFDRALYHLARGHELEASVGAIA